MKSVLTIVVVSLALVSCATSPKASLNRKLDEKLAQETSVTNRADLRNKASSLITSAPGLTDSQRSRLMALKDSSGAQTDRLVAQSLKLRAVLVKTLLDPNADTEEVELVKARIKKVEQERISLFFQTIHSVNTILGRWGSRTERENQEFFDQMMLETLDLNYL